MIMEKAILYKEWIKTRGYCLLALIVSCGMVVYSLIKMRYIIEIKGVEHLWMVMMERDAVFVDRLTYLPVIVGTLLAIVQFVPEMQQKRMKLMLHLPYPRFLNISIMLLYGLCCLLTCFALHFAGRYMALYTHILATRALQSHAAHCFAVVYSRLHGISIEHLVCTGTYLEKAYCKCSNYCCHNKHLFSLNKSRSL